MNYQQINSSDIFNDIEKRIKNNIFKSKKELSEYIFNLKERGFLSQDDLQRKMPELLGLYDNLNQNSEISLNMENYKGVGLENQELIVAKQDDRILKTLENHENIAKEFMQVQNEITADNKDALSNADIVFNHMATYQKEELNLISLSEVSLIDNLDIEILQKIKFFISNEYINPSSFKVDPKNGVFYNTETSEVLEVRKDEATGEYKIFKGSEIIYSDVVEKNEEEEYEQTINLDSKEEEMSYENKNKPKTRVLRPPHMNDYNNFAFSKMNFLLLIITMFSVSIVVIKLLNKFIK